VNRFVEVSDLVPGVQASYGFANQFMEYGNMNTYRQLDPTKFLADVIVGRRCSGYNDSDRSNSAKRYIRFGCLYGVPISSDDPEVLPSKMSIPAPAQQKLQSKRRSVHLTAALP
jgi:hypothetical protein